MCRRRQGEEKPVVLHVTSQVDINPKSEKDQVSSNTISTPPCNPITQQSPPSSDQPITAESQQFKPDSECSIDSKLCDDDHHGRQPSNPIQGSHEEHGQPRQGGGLVGHGHQRITTPNDQVREEQVRTGVPRSVEGHGLLCLVHRKLPDISQTGAPGVHPLLATSHRDDRSSHRNTKGTRPPHNGKQHVDRCNKTSKQGVPENQGQSQGHEFKGVWTTIPNGQRGGLPGHGRLGPSHDRTQRPGGRAAGSHDIHGNSHEPDHVPAHPDSDRSRQPSDTQCLTDLQSRMITQACEEFNAFLSSNESDLQNNPKEHDHHKDNWVLKEFKKYIEDKKHQIPRSHRIDVLEIYCSSDSELTQQAQKQGLTAIRFGLKQGDLSTYEGRRRLYILLIRFRPRDVWMSPACRAWCKWNQFNASKSPEAAARVMEARQQDEVHLQLCSAVYWFQQEQENHFHLEQPVGSHMVFQEELAPIVEGTYRAVCHQCKAGNLKHPQTKEYLKKGMQILTTSRIMDHMIKQHTCPRDHQHTHVAGNYRDHNGQMQQVSSFTERYTPLFAHRVCRAMIASCKIDEKPFFIPVFVVRNHEETEAENGTESESKRRRLAVKQAPPDAYEPDESSMRTQDRPEAVLPEDRTVLPAESSADFVLTPTGLQEIIDKALPISPKVGAVCQNQGELIDFCRRRINQPFHQNCGSV